MRLKRDITSKLKRVESLLDQPSVPTDLQQDAEEEMRDVYREIVRLQSEKAFETHMAKAITDAYKARLRGDRDSPLCSCPRATCALTEGRVPPQVRSRSGRVLQTRPAYDLVSDYLQDHQGAEVMHELVEDWQHREGDLYQELSRIHSTLEDNNEIEGIA